MGQQKPINLEELKAQLSTDATRRAKAMDDLNRSLKNRMWRLEKEIEERRDICRVMFNRCLALTQGSMCGFCAERTRALCMKERDKGKQRQAEEHRE